VKKLYLRNQENPKEQQQKEYLTAEERFCQLETLSAESQAHGHSQERQLELICNPRHGGMAHHGPPTGPNTPL